MIARWLFRRRTRTTSVGPEPTAVVPTRFYGDGKTIHHTSTIDVVLDDRGNVQAVWFRCQPLPFTVSRHASGTDLVPLQPDVQIVGLTLRDL